MRAALVGALSLALVPSAGAASPPRAAPAVTTASLLGEMADLDHLAYPARYVHRQFSGFDRSSLAGPGDPDSWFGNMDRMNYLRVEPNGERVLAEAQGPGAIVRIWSADPAGTLRIYLDGAVALEADFASLTSGQVPPFTEPFAGVRARGHNLYFPFPFARSMKVTVTEDCFYHVNVRIYDASARVLTYTRPPIVAMSRARARLAGTSSPRPGRTVPFAGKARLAGPRTITRLELDRVHGDLRVATIRIRVDGELTVCAPLGDFFGSAPGRSSYRTFPLGTFVCEFPMPFTRTAEIEITGAHVTGKLTVRDGAAAPLRFYAWWRGNPALATRPRTDFSVLNGQGGRGRYVGTALSILNPVRSWWGEGDEKVSVDGESFPSVFGTGTEDYFGYAWGDTTLFQHAFHGQTRCDGPGTLGATALCRFHVIDDIPFERSIRFDLEMWHHVDTVVGLSTVAYWYAEPGFTHDFSEPADADRSLAMLDSIEIAGAPGAIEGENLLVIDFGGRPGAPAAMDVYGSGWSKMTHIFWEATTVGDTFKLRIPARASAGTKLVLALTKAPDYGIFRVRLDGAILADALDLYGASVAPAGELAFPVAVPAGECVLEFEVVGRNPAAPPVSAFFGFDYMKVE